MSVGLKIAPGVIREDGNISPFKPEAKLVGVFASFATFRDMRSYIVREFRLSPTSPDEWTIEQLEAGRFVPVRPTEDFSGPPAVRLTNDGTGIIFVIWC